jgi:hypothetical protein
MRENKCLYYTGKDFRIGDIFENINLYDLSGKNQIMLFDKINKDDKYTFIGAFSTS